MKLHQWLTERSQITSFWTHKPHALPRSHFWQAMRVPDRASPLLYNWATYEVTFPYRTSHSTIVRAPFVKTAIVLGHWRQLTDPMSEKSVKAHLSLAITVRNALGQISDQTAPPHMRQPTAYAKVINDWKDTPKVVLATEEYGRGKNYRFWQANHTH
jgi:hypothetical protein